MDPESLLVNRDTMVSAKRQVVNRQEETLVALMKGVVPDKIWVHGNIWGRIRKIFSSYLHVLITVVST